MHFDDAIDVKKWRGWGHTCMNEYLKKYKINNIKSLSLLILCIGSGFIFGNVFGIYTRTFSNPYVFVVHSMCFMEFINFFKYRKKCQFIEKNYLGNTCLSTCLNATKRGFLIGVFVEAFKVGS
jgi:hypothetical protein